MASVNKVLIIGNLGKDPEMRFMPNGNAVANFSVATTESWKDKNSGEKKELTEWHNVSVFGKLAEICGEYLKKGSSVYIEGKLKTDKYEKNGVDHYSTKVIADQMRMLGSKGGDTGNNQGRAEGRTEQADRGRSQGGGGNAAQAKKPQQSADFDDQDIPF